MDKGDRGNMFDPCLRKKPFSYLDLTQALTIKTLSGLEQWAETHPGTFAVENLEGETRVSKIWASGPHIIFKYLNFPYGSSLLKVWILLSTLSFIFIFHCNPGAVRRTKWLCWAEQEGSPSCLLLLASLPPFHSFLALLFTDLQVFHLQIIVHTCVYAFYITLPYLDYFMELEA